MITPENKAAMTEGRRRALKEGKYEPLYRRQSKRMKGKPHGRDATISAAHRVKGEEHPSSRHHRLIAPDGNLHFIDNIEHFVRTNSDMFSKDAVIERRKPNRKLFTRAGNGLQAVSNGSKRQWRGWVKA